MLLLGMLIAVLSSPAIRRNDEMANVTFDNIFNDSAHLPRVDTLRVCKCGTKLNPYNQGRLCYTCQSKATIPKHTVSIHDPVGMKQFKARIYGSAKRRRVVKPKSVNLGLTEGQVAAMRFMAANESVTSRELAEALGRTQSSHGNVMLHGLMTRGYVRKTGGFTRRNYQVACLWEITNEGREFVQTIEGEDN